MFLRNRVLNQSGKKKHFLNFWPWSESEINWICEIRLRASDTLHLCCSDACAIQHVSVIVSVLELEMLNLWYANHKRRNFIGCSDHRRKIHLPDQATSQTFCENNTGWFFKIYPCHIKVQNVGFSYTPKLLAPFNRMQKNWLYKINTKSCSCCDVQLGCQIWTLSKACDLNSRDHLHA